MLYILEAIVSQWKGRIHSDIIDEFFKEGFTWKI